MGGDESRGRCYPVTGLGLVGLVASWQFACRARFSHMHVQNPRGESHKKEKWQVPAGDYFWLTASK